MSVPLEPGALMAEKGEGPGLALSCPPANSRHTQQSSKSSLTLERKKKILTGNRF